MNRLLILTTLLILTACAAPVTATPTVVPSNIPASTPISELIQETATAQSSPSPTMPHCPDGVIVFSSYLDISHPDETKQTYAVCPDASALTEISPELETHWNNSDKGKLEVRDDGHSLVIVDQTGSEIKRLIDNIQGEIRHPTWSSDGNYVAYGKANNMEIGIYRYYRVEVIHVETGIISTNFIPADDSDGYDALEVPSKAYQWIEWSPVGDQILMLNDASPIDIANVTCSPDTHICTASPQIVDARMWRGLAHWSPDGQSFAYPCLIDQVDGICILDIAGNLLLEKGPQPGISHVRSVIWSPDGEQIAFAAKLDGDQDTDVFILSLQSGELLNLTGSLQGSQGSPAWLP